MNRFLTLALLIIASHLNGQEIEMSLSQFKEKVLQNNLDLKIQEIDYTIKEADYLQSRAMYYPDVSLDYTGITTSSPLMAFGSKLNQSIIDQNDFNPALLNDPDAVQNFSVQLKVQQPIINLDKKHERNAAKLGMEATLLKSKRSKEYLEFAASKIYMQLQFTYKVVEVLEQALTTALQNQTHAQNNFDAGYLQKVDLLEIDVRINELKNNISATKNQLQNISDQMQIMMHEEVSSLIKPIDPLTLNSESMQSEIPSDRSDLLAMDKGNEAYQEILQSQKKTFMPRLNAFAVFETNDNSPIAVGASNYLAGVQVSWNIFDGMQRSAKIQRAKATLEKGRIAKQKYLKENEAELQKTIRNHNQSAEKLETVQLAITQAEESLRIRSNRFKEGLEKASDIMMAETSFAEKKLQEYETILEINIAKLYSKFLSTSNDNNKN